MYKIVLSKDVKKFLAKHTKLAEDFYDKIPEFSKNPINSTKLDIKRLSWYKNRFRLRLWKYRLIYELWNDKLIIFVFKSWSRWDIYK